MTSTTPKMASGDRYRHTSPDGDLEFELTLIRQVERWGGPTLGLQQLAVPVLGAVWVAEITDETLGTYQVLCTPEGLRRRGFKLITTEAGDV